MESNKGILYPNLYLINVGAAGVGKTLSTDLVATLLRELPDHFLAPSSVTTATLIDALEKAHRRVVRVGEDPSLVEFNSLTIVSNELGVFLPSYENDFISTLTDLWDCKAYSQTRRTAKIDINLPATQLNFTSATTPSYMSKLLPEGAWDQGFMSRTIMLYADEPPRSNPFEKFPLDEQLWKDLVHDLKIIKGMYGKMEWTEEAVEAYVAWYMKGGKPYPDHPRLFTYTTRRPANLFKLCMIACASSCDDYTITIDHFTEAFDWLTEAEDAMGEVFKAMRSGGDRTAMEETFHYAMREFMRTKKEVPHSKLVHYLSERVETWKIDKILEVMVNAGLFKRSLVGSTFTYTPISNREV